MQAVLIVLISMVFSITAQASLEDPVQLTNDAANDYQAQWSPDGKGILYSTDRGGDYDLWLADLPTGEQSRITDLKGDEDHASFSPDGSLIVYTYRVDSRQEIWIKHPASGRTVQITSQSQNFWPCWSPDGRKLVFTSTRTGNWDLWIIDVERQIQTLLQQDK